ncbi:hypothetical protein VKT23_013493 [Stygiomarasmius scandens]|uniref:F-box domain-containing protein n=1 Tax=Marasmiellus scandens TaxID=2682957 RepID=A0ABR1J2X6_9AGAR
MPLSAELTDNIIDLIDDFHTLKNCSLVSKAWRPRSQYRLFGTLALLSPPARSDLGSSSVKPEQVLKYALDFIEIANASWTLSSAVRKLAIPFDAVCQIGDSLAFPFRNLQTLEIVLVMEERAREELARNMNKVQLDSKGRTVQQATPGLVPLSVFQQNRSLRTLKLTNMLIDESLMRSMFDGLGAGHEHSLLSSLEFESCAFGGIPAELVSRELYHAKFQKLSLIFDETFHKNFLVERFDISGVHSLSTDTPSCPVIRKFGTQMQSLTFYGTGIIDEDLHDDRPWLELKSLTHLHLVCPEYVDSFTSRLLLFFSILCTLITPEFHNSIPLQVVSVSYGFLPVNSLADMLLCRLARSWQSLREIAIIHVPHNSRKFVEETLVDTLETGLLKIETESEVEMDSNAEEVYSAT